MIDGEREKERWLKLKTSQSHYKQSKIKRNSLQSRYKIEFKQTER